MIRTRILWLIFLLCLAVVLSAMAWVSLMAMRLDEAETEARNQAGLEESIRLALWRMDSAVAPILAQESARPYFVYSTFLPVERSYGRMFNPNRDQGEKLAPSPLLAGVSPFLLVHFQFAPDGTLSSPCVPLEGNSALATPRYLSPQAVATARQHLDRLRVLTDRSRLMALLPPEPARSPEMVITRRARSEARQDRVQPSFSAQGRVSSQTDFSQRSQVVTNYLAQQQEAILGANRLIEPSWAETDVAGVVMNPLWLDGNLALARRVTVGGQCYVQGCLVDWPGLKRSLLDTVEDLLPDAELEPVVNSAPRGEARLLASLPARLVPGGPAANAAAKLSPVRVTLRIAWVCMLLAAAAVALLLAGVMRLSERRAAFVSAVTHELRTPLTTFHMYTEMLTSGMVPDARRQQEYLDTLRVEASRLSHLVENVLAYARLERGRRGARVEAVAVGRMLENVEPRLADRAAQASMQLVHEAEPAALAAVVCVNPSAVEQILFNLVDNACKYAAAAEDPRLHLTVQREDHAVRIRVRDHGPGITGRAARRLFRPFAKSAHEAANSAPGIGLGLALSRRLARDMGAVLTWERSESSGACFCLELPLASEVECQTKSPTPSRV